MDLPHGKRAGRAHLDRRPLARLLLRHGLPGLAGPSRLDRRRVRGIAEVRLDQRHVSRGLRGASGLRRRWRPRPPGSSARSAASTRSRLTWAPACCCRGCAASTSGSTWTSPRTSASATQPRPAASPSRLSSTATPPRSRAALAQTLRPGERPLVLTDGVFPISGEIAPLARLPGRARRLRGLDPLRRRRARDGGHRRAGARHARVRRGRQRCGPLLHRPHAEQGNRRARRADCGQRRFRPAALAERARARGQQSRAHPRRRSVRLGARLRRGPPRAAGAAVA